MSVTVNNNMTSSLKNMQRKISNLPKEAFTEFVKDTPIRTGNARRKTKLSGNKIIAGYDYAQKLDEGFSRQAPDGMTKPTEEFIKKRMTQIIKGK